MTKSEDAQPEGGGPQLLRRETFHRIVGGAALTLFLVTLWCLTHHYRGLVGDAELYALQAQARNEPGLARDVFLSGTSQDRFTLFPPIYSLFIRILGPRTAALWLLVLFKVGFLGAVWAFGRRLFDARTAFLTTAFAIAIAGEYGAYHVFHIAEDMLTARTLAEAIAMAGLSLHVYGHRKVALGLAAIGLLLHALMALPMVLLLLGLRVGMRTTALGALAIVGAVLGAALTAVLAPHWSPSFVAVMDPSWLEMVRERSQFVFLQLWRWDDWNLNIRPLLSLALTTLVLRDAKVRDISASAIIVGVAGLSVGLIAGTIGPVALLLQGQAWRWMWVPELVGLLLVVPTAAQLWRSAPCGPVCAVLLTMGWLLSDSGSTYCVGASLCLWVARGQVPPSAGAYLRFGAIALGASVLGWIIAHGWAGLFASFAGSETEERVAQMARRLMGLNGLPIIVAFLMWSAIQRSRSVALPGVTVAALVGLAASALPGALADRRAEGSIQQISEFAEWRDAIPPGANVFVPSQYYSASFAWFTLQRPNYLSVDQSSGVIFSKATAAEIRRRAQVLRPIEEPDWRLLSQLAIHGGSYVARALPLTKDRLLAVCLDPSLNFVVAKENVGFGFPLRHDWAGPWNGWYLYDCKRVNSPKDSA